VQPAASATAIQPSSLLDSHIHTTTISTLVTSANVIELWGLGTKYRPCQLQGSEMHECLRTELHSTKITLFQAGVVHPTPWVGVARSLVRGVSRVLQLLGYG
jgi:hypothetical protein